jgi:predicted ATP-dependent protease
VIIPRANVRHLMLREDVVAAVAKGEFHLYAVGSVDEGIEILTGLAAGELSPEGTYPDGTVNARVATRLAQLHEAVRMTYPPA